jgi:ketosteroid isomerase-like protein
LAFDIEALLDLWTGLPADPAEAADAFRTLYTDPVVVNGATLGADDLVSRAHALQQTFSPLRREVLDVCDAGEKVAVALRLSGRQVGPMHTAAGVLPATGRDIGVRVIDILTLTDGRISQITMVADELGAVVAVGAARLAAES